MNDVQKIAATIAVLVASSPAFACSAPKRLYPSDFATAEVIVIGRVTKYEAVIDPVATESIRHDLEQLPAVRELAKDYEWISYGKFDVQVDEVVKGTVPETLAVYWLPSTIGPAKTLVPGRYILGLGRIDPLATHYINPRQALPLPPDALTLEEKACAGAFIAEYSSEMGSKVVQLLNVQP